MNAVITGDIVNSSKVSPDIWLPQLKDVLNLFGRTPNEWEIYRGDSFQLMIKDPLFALKASIQIKAALKSIKYLDIRMAIGIGDISHSSKKITESNGPAFIYSGEKFETLKQDKLNLAIKTEWEDFDRDINVFLKLALLTMDHWTINEAEMMKLTLANPNKPQSELGGLIGLKQNAVSNRLKRAAFDEISEMIQVYKLKLKEKL